MPDDAVTVVVPAVAVEPASEYAARLAQRRQVHADRERADRAIALARLIIAVLGIAGSGVAFATHAASPLVGLLALPVFLVLVVLHERVLQRKSRAQRAIEHLERGIARIEDRWQGRGNAGDRFADAEHPFALDLDLFGAGSLFELLCTARTRAGEERLAEYLTRTPTAAVVRARQGAVRELVPALDLREDVDALAARVAAKSDEAALLSWAARENGMPAWLLPMAAIFVTASVVAIALAAFNMVPGLVPAAMLALQSAFAFAMRTRVSAALAGVERALEELKVLSLLLARVETARFSDALLLSLQARLRTGDGEPPSRVVAQLQGHVERLEQRKNQLFIPLAAVLLWRTVHAALIARWRARAGPRLAVYIDVIAEMEALLSLSAYAFEHPGDVEPRILDDAPTGSVSLAALSLGHPLLAGGGVRNDVALGGTHPQLLVISGSNMSGKSTFLRTIGVNAVLALAGGRVRASEMALAPLAIGCTLKVQDSLAKGASRFYAEILRLKAIMALAEAGPLLFLVDELLAGTNSRDRQAGGAAILDGLVALGAIGLATTHDLALTSVADALGARARNAHFEDVLEGERVVFDYRLRDGVVSRSNAIALMRAVGLRV
ncbi:MAG TPA: DNA mismatch repair protein MutS [Myxococcota bacterium]|jgi:hypothetical protein